MAVYIAVFVLVLLVLWASYRALGAGAVLEPVDQRALLVRLLGFTHARAYQLGEAVEDEADPAEAEALPAIAADARKRLAGYQQQLARLDGVEALGEQLTVARTWLSRAIESLGWACRMIEAGNFGDNSGVQQAVQALRADAADCLSRANAVLAPGLYVPAVPADAATSSSS